MGLDEQSSGSRLKHTSGLGSHVAEPDAGWGSGGYLEHSPRKHSKGKTGG